MLCILEAIPAVNSQSGSRLQCLEHPYFDELNGPLGPATRAPALTHTRSSADTGGRSDRASPSRTRKVEDRPASGLELSDLSSDKGDYEYSRGGGGEGGVRDRDRDASYGAAELVRETREVLSSLDNLRITPHRSPHSQVRPPSSAFPAVVPVVDGSALIAGGARLARRAGVEFPAAAAEGAPQLEG